MDEDRVYTGAAADHEGAPADASDELDARIDYEGIAARSESDRRAGRLLSHQEVERQVEAWLSDLERQHLPGRRLSA